MFWRGYELGKSPPMSFINLLTRQSLSAKPNTSRAQRHLSRFVRKCLLKGVRANNTFNLPRSNDGVAHGSSVCIVLSFNFIYKSIQQDLSCFIRIHGPLTGKGEKLDTTHTKISWPDILKTNLVNFANFPYICLYFFPANRV